MCGTAAEVTPVRDGRRPRDRRPGPDHAGDPVRLHRHGARQARAVVALARVRAEAAPCRVPRLADPGPAWPTARRRMCLPRLRQVRARRPDLRARAARRATSAGERPPDPRLGRGDSGGDRRLAHRAVDPARDGPARRRPRRRSWTRRSRSPSGSSRTRTRAASTSATSAAARGTCSSRRRAPGEADKLF